MPNCVQAVDTKTKESKSAATIRRRTNHFAIAGSRNKSENVPNMPEDDKSDIWNSDTGVPPGGPTALKFIMSSQKTLFLALLAFRILNALIIQTSFVPDEYWQSIEVAHNMVFGYGYLTWEWKKGLRTYIYPLLFSIFYKLLAIFHLDTRFLLTKGPRLIQGVLAAISDLYIYRMSLKLSRQKRVAQWTLFCQITSWFIFYSYTRTLTNSVESVLTTMALYYFPWPDRPQSKSDVHNWPRYATLVSLAVILRPTAAITWIPLCAWHLSVTNKRSNHLWWSVVKQWVIRGLLVLFLSAVVDRAFYGQWTNVLYNFLQFNVFADVASFYGVHPWHWYLTQGLPVVLGTHLILLIIAFKKSIEPVFFWILAWSIAIYSFLGHKEFRFLSGVLPFVMHLCGSTLHVLLDDTNPNPNDEVCRNNGINPRITPAQTNTRQRSKRLFVLVVTCMIAVNLPIAFYTSLIHQRGTIDVMNYLSKEVASSVSDATLSLLFLMPCHSTPYYSYIHRNISMRFLTCEPNLARSVNYTDEADYFYESPNDWLDKEYLGISHQNLSKPSHIIMFEPLYIQLWSKLRQHNYETCNKFFHTHFSGGGRIGNYVIVMCRPAGVSGFIEAKGLKKYCDLEAIRK